MACRTNEIRAAIDHLAESGRVIAGRSILGMQNLRLLLESVHAVYKADDLEDSLDLVQIAQLVLERGQQLQGNVASRFVGLLHCAPSNIGRDSHLDLMSLVCLRLERAVLVT